MSDGISTFIDANILIYIVEYKKDAVDKWFEQLYDFIYIHKDVLDELRTKGVRDFFQTKITDSDQWILFDPEDERSLTEEDYNLYEGFYNETRKQFGVYQEGRDYKSTTDKGDIAILAGCLFMEIPLITSQDSDYKTVIDKFNLKVSYGIESIPDEKIKVHDLLELGNKLIGKRICKRSDYRKFVKVSIGVNNFEWIDSSLIEEPGN